MASVRIVNASPLILLGRIRRRELVFVGKPIVRGETGVRGWCQKLICR